MIRSICWQTAAFLALWSVIIAGMMIGSSITS